MCIIVFMVLLPNNRDNTLSLRIGGGPFGSGWLGARRRRRGFGRNCGRVDRHGPRRLSQQDNLGPHGWLVFTHGYEPNVPAQARRAKGVRLSTETRSRRCLQPACSTSLFVNQTLSCANDPMTCCMRSNSILLQTAVAPALTSAALPASCDDTAIMGKRG